MLRTIRAALLFGLISLAVTAVASDGPVPRVLIIQLHNPLIESGSAITPPIDPNIACANILAQAFDDDGRVAPVVWSMTDPIFRDAISKRKIQVTDADPTPSQAQIVASKLDCDYILFVKTVKAGGDVVGQARLYRGRGEKWRDPEPDPGQLATLKKMLKQKQMTKEAYDLAVQQQEYRHLQVLATTANLQDIERAEDNTARSMVRTWSEAMVGGPFKSLPSKHRATTPNPGAGQNPLPNGPGVTIPNVGQTKPPDGPTRPPQDPTPPKNPVIDNTTLKASLKSYLANKQISNAISLLRDAIDAAPLDSERRALLITILMDNGSAELAATTARQAALILPDKVEFRVLAARAWLAAGKPDEAQTDLNEAVAREPDSADTRLLLGQIALAKGDLTSSLDHLSAGIAKNPTGDLYFERAVANILAGNAKGAEADMAKAKELGLPSEGDVDRYREAVREIDLVMARESGVMRGILQKAAVNRKDPAQRALLEKNASLTTVRASFLEKLAVPSSHQKSHDQRVLALKLLLQCLGDVRSYLASGDQESLSDARLNLGEALSGLTAARTAFESESAPPSAHASQ